MPKRKSSCIMCRGKDNQRMVQCDSCNRWCHYDCAMVDDEIEQCEWNCKLCLVERLADNSSQMGTPQGTSPQAMYGTPTNERSSVASIELEGAVGGQTVTIYDAQGVMPPTTLSTETPMENASSTAISQSPMYTLTDTTAGDKHASTRTTETQRQALYNNNKLLLLDGQATARPATSTDFNLKSQSTAMLQQHAAQGLNGTYQQRSEMQHVYVDNSQQNKIQYIRADNRTLKGQRNVDVESMRQNMQQLNLDDRHVGDSITHRQRTLELEMLEEEQQLKQRYLHRKYEILQQFGGEPNNMHHDTNVNSATAVSPNRPTAQQLAARQVLPRELPSFNGDPEEWPIFISSFENSTAVGGYSEAENLVRLQQCLKGKAREIVRNRLLLPSMVPEILQTLKMYFGRPEIILERMIDKARQMPPPRDRLDAIIDFALCVRNICSTIEACKLDANLNNPLLVKEFLDKLSNNFKLQWAMHPKPFGMPSLKIFSDWLYSLAEAASQVTTPVFSKKSGVINTHTRIEKSIEPKCYVCDSAGHKVAQCSRFAGMPLNEKWSAIKSKRICSMCLKMHRRKCYADKECGVDGCKSKHHPLLHKVNIVEVSSSNTAGPESTAVVNSHYEQEKAIFFRIIPVRIHSGGKFLDTYAFLDEGSSITLMEEEVFKSLNMRGAKESLCLRWTSGATRVEDSSYRTSFDISSPENKSSYILQGVRTVKNLSLPQQSIDRDAIRARYPHLSTIPIQSYRNIRPTILIGSDNWHLAVPLKICEGAWNEPIATKTRLGWAVQGVASQGAQNHQVNVHLCECKHELDEIHEAVKQMYALESSDVNKFYSAEDEKAMHALESTCKYTNGRFEIGLPWRNDNVNLPNSYDTALKRSICLKDRMRKDVNLKTKIEKEINNLVDKGYARKMMSDEVAKPDPHTWYLPIFVTSNPNKPNKVRLVWDAAAKTNGTSLNDFLLSGPDLLTSLIDVLLEFRIGRIAICGDIAEMFHQIRVRKEDINAQRFLWWNEIDQKSPSVYVMSALTFGLNCAPCMAHYIRNKNADRYEAQYPRAVEAVKRHHYVDDLIDSLDSEDDAKHLGEDVRKIHASGGFKIRNWSSNSTFVLEYLCGQDNVTQSTKELASTEKILGVHWDPVKDVFKYIYKFHRLERNVLSEDIIPTKRELLKVLMSIYDPLGFVCCYTTGLKILLQEVWRSCINWDEQLSGGLIAKWYQWKEHFSLITSLEVPRCYSPQLQSSESVQLHTFVDAGELGYAAICYLRIQCGENVSIVVVMAKSKVAPLKPMSIPRLELQAAVLGIRLALKVLQIERIPITSCNWWSDSKTVLKWLRMDPRRFQQFVMHRLGEILEHSQVRQWRWVPSKRNPADLATKMTAKPNTSLWLNGPEFLVASEDEWPICTDLGPADATEVRPHFLQIHTQVAIVTANVDYFSEWKRLYRALATFFLYIERLKARAKKMTAPRDVTFEMICRSKLMLYRQAQSDEYAEEINCLRQGKNIAKNSPLICLNVFLDDDGLLRERGRTEHLCYHKDVIILPKRHHVTLLIVKDAHERHHHVSHETVINNLKGQYYISKLRVVYRQVRNECQICKNVAATPKIPLMASLPPARLGVFERPFTYTGIDYFGPMPITVGRRCEKRWGVIFTCLTTRAIHLEVAHSLGTSSCVMCIRNFIGRRGCPRQIYTDNGTNFKATEKILREELQKQDHSILEKTFDDMKWFFNPPAAPHMGGAWERLVRSVKTVLHNAYPKTHFNDETLRCALIEVEFIINSRPLTFVSLESCDDEAITPNHLLLGSSTGYKPICSESSNLRQKWYQTQSFAERFWRRWVREYAPMITRRNKWFIKQSPIKIGDVVLIVDENQPRNSWLKGIVIETVIAKDDQVRRVTVRTKNGVLQRPASKIAVLDVAGRSESKLGEVSPAYGGGNVTDDAVIVGAVNYIGKL